MDFAKEILINVSTSETRVAIVEQEKLVEMSIERPDNSRTIGNIYTGYIDNVVPGMNSVFVNIDDGPNGFSHLGDFAFGLVSDDIINGKYNFTDINEDITSIETVKEGRRRLEKNDKVLVQVIKESIGTKGPRLTSKISIPGRYVVLVPNDHGVKVSKKITNVLERRRLKKMVNSLIPDNFAVIVRTAAEDRDSSAFTKDILDTYSIWKKVAKNFKKADKPTLLHKDYDMAASIVRDLFTDEVGRILIDSNEMYQNIRDYVFDVSPELVDRVELYTDGEPIFDAFYNINKEYYISLSREVFLKKGGSIVIDHTEALVAIDVNSKRFIRNKSHEDNNITLNLAAAKEIARQIRLRDMGGLVVIDFIDMEEPENREKLYNEFKGYFKTDKAKVNIEPISRFGLIEMTRQRLKPSLTQTVFDACPMCFGKGIVRSQESTYIQIDRWLKNYKYLSGKLHIRLKVNEELFKFLTEGEFSRLLTLMIKHWMKIDVEIENSLASHIFKCLPSDGEQDITKEYLS